MLIRSRSLLRERAREHVWGKIKTVPKMIQELIQPHIATTSCVPRIEKHSVRYNVGGCCARSLAASTPPRDSTSSVFLRSRRSLKIETQAHQPSLRSMFVESRLSASLPRSGKDLPVAAPLPPRLRPGSRERPWRPRWPYMALKRLGLRQAGLSDRARYSDLVRDSLQRASTRPQCRRKTAQRETRAFRPGPRQNRIAPRGDLR